MYISQLGYSFLQSLRNETEINACLVVDMHVYKSNRTNMNITFPTRAHVEVLSRNDSLSSWLLNRPKCALFNIFHRLSIVLLSSMLAMIMFPAVSRILLLSPSRCYDMFFIGHHLPCSFFNSASKECMTAVCGCGFQAQLIIAITLPILTQTLKYMLTPSCMCALT